MCCPGAIPDSGFLLPRNRPGTRPSPELCLRLCRRGSTDYSTPQAMNRIYLNTALCLGCLLVTPSTAGGLPDAVELRPGPVNGVVIHRNERALVVYGVPQEPAPRADWLLLTHARRDVVWAGYSVVRASAKVVAPTRTVSLLTEPDDYWQRQLKERYHDYDQQSTRLPTRPLPVTRAVSSGDRLEWPPPSSLISSATCRRRSRKRGICPRPLRR